MSHFKQAVAELQAIMEPDAETYSAALGISDEREEELENFIKETAKEAADEVEKGNKKAGNSSVFITRCMNEAKGLGELLLMADYFCQLKESMKDPMREMLQAMLGDKDEGSE